MTAMNLKTYLKTALKEDVASYQRLIANRVRSLQFLDEVGIKDATYEVHLRSMWEREGEKSSTTMYTGSLEGAIKEAEKRFKGLNHRDDVQAQYAVSINLGAKLSYTVPDKYWTKFKEKH